MRGFEIDFAIVCADSSAGFTPTQFGFIFTKAYICDVFNRIFEIGSFQARRSDAVGLCSRQGASTKHEAGIARKDVKDSGNVCDIYDPVA